MTPAVFRQSLERLHGYESGQCQCGFHNGILRSQAKTPMNPRHQGRRFPNFYRPPTTPGADFQCTARNTERPRPPPLVILLERLFLNSGPKDFWLSAIWPSLTASDGLALPSRGGDFRSRSSGERRRSFWEPREAPARSSSRFKTLSERLRSCVSLMARSRPDNSIRRRLLSGSNRTVEQGTRHFRF
jgi:hypothetical protein